MKIQKRLFAFLTAALLLLPLTGCLVPKETDTPAEPTAVSGSVAAPDGAGSSSSAAFDGEALAIELGDIKITAQEVSNTFDQYINYFAYGSGLDEEMLDQFMRMTEEQLIRYYLPEWKAAQLGVTIPEEQDAQCRANAQAEVDEERDQLLTYYGSQGLAEDVSELTDEQRSEALETINAELAEIFGEGYTFDDYLAMRYQDALSSMHSDAFTELLHQQHLTDVSVDQTAIDEWYETTLAEQKEQFDADPNQYLDYMNGTGLTDTQICLYVPAKAAQLEFIYIPEDESSADRIAENTETMTKLEAEYGALMLRGEDETRQKEIETEYAALKTETETLQAEQTAKAKDLADKAYADLSGGMSFETAMETYNSHDENEGHASLTVFMDGKEQDHPALAEAAEALTPGAYSQPILVDNDYYIIRLVENTPEGVIDRASIAEALNTVASDSIREEAWLAKEDEWLTEAKDAAVYHREAYYDLLISMYLG